MDGATEVTVRMNVLEVSAPVQTSPSTTADPTPLTEELLQCN